MTQICQIILTHYHHGWMVKKNYFFRLVNAIAFESFNYLLFS